MRLNEAMQDQEGDRPQTSTDCHFFVGPYLGPHQASKEFLTNETMTYDQNMLSSRLTIYNYKSIS